MKLKVLGTQSPYCTLGHNCPGFLISDDENCIMLDCGSGTHRSLEIPKDLKNFHVFLTHLHEDHYNDIGILQYASFCNHNLNRIVNPIHIYLPSSPVDKYQKIINEENSFATYHVISASKIFHIGNMNITFMKTKHPIETYAIKISNREKTIVYTSDLSFSSKNEIVEFSKDADLLICESSLLTSCGFPEINSHLTAKQAGTIAKEANVKLLILTHFWPDESPHNFVIEAKTVFDNSIAATENQVFYL